MNKILILGITALASIVLGACTSQPAQRPLAEQLLASSLHPDTTSAYQQAQQNVVEQSSDADFDTLRALYAGSKFYAPWDTAEHEAGLAILNAMEDQDYALCLTLAQSVLKLNFTNLDAHFGAYNCSRGHDEQTTVFHARVLKGLFKSISNSGDGNAPETAYMVNSANEARAFVRLSSLLMFRQESVTEGGRYYHLIFSAHPTKEDVVELYFDLTKAQLHNFKATELR